MRYVESESVVKRAEHSKERQLYHSRSRSATVAIEVGGDMLGEVLVLDDVIAMVTVEDAVVVEAELEPTGWSQVMNASNEPSERHAIDCENEIEDDREQAMMGVSEKDAIVDDAQSENDVENE